MYKVRIETFNGSVSVINLPSKGAVAQFLTNYPAKLPAGVAVKVSCDLLGVRGRLMGKAVL
jgi:hypothetical protein